jgi:8-amino-7-oxononanoate synthase
MKPVVFAGNDYLAMATEPRVAEAMCRVARARGISTGAGRWSIGWSDLHQQLEEELQRFFGSQDACIQGAAYLCGPAFLAGAAEEYDTVFCDENSHPNLYLGMRGAGYRIRPYRHLDGSDLRRRLSRATGKPPLVVTDGLFGISGEFAPLGEIIGAAAAHGAPVFVDDAHGVFTVGSAGRGSLELSEPGGPAADPGAVVVMGSMSKALGVYGGFVAGARRWIDKTRRAVNYVGSTPPPFPVVAACLEALRIVRAEPGRRTAMHSAAARMRAIAAGLGIGLVSDSRAPIVTLLMESAAQARRCAAELSGRGLLLKYLDYPSEPRKNLLRAAARPVYGDDHLACFAEVLERTRSREKGNGNE